MWVAAKGLRCGCREIERETTMRTTTAAVAMTEVAEAPASAVRRRVRRDGIVILEFDRPGSSANVFDEATLLAMRRQPAVAPPGMRSVRRGDER